MTLSLPWKSRNGDSLLGLVYNESVESGFVSDGILLEGHGSSSKNWFLKIILLGRKLVACELKINPDDCKMNKKKCKSIEYVIFIHYIKIV